jgi:hypothetical protein
MRKSRYTRSLSSYTVNPAVTGRDLQLTSDSWMPLLTLILQSARLNISQDAIPTWTVHVTAFTSCNCVVRVVHLLGERTPLRGEVVKPHWTSHQRLDSVEFDRKNEQKNQQYEEK